MKRLLLLVLALFVLAATAGAGTFADLQDAEESLGNSFAAGTLDLKLGSGPEWTDGLDEPLVVEDVRPGDVSPAPLVIGVKNTGTIGGRLSACVTNVVSEEGCNPGWETGDTGEPGELDRYLQLTVSFGGQKTVTCGLGELGPGEEGTVFISWHVPEAAGNEIIGDRVRFNVEFILEQS
jgi:hypothetical protein